MYIHTQWYGIHVRMHMVNRTGKALVRYVEYALWFNEQLAESKLSCNQCTMSTLMYTSKFKTLMSGYMSSTYIGQHFVLTVLLIRDVIIQYGLIG